MLSKRRKFYGSPTKFLSFWRGTVISPQKTFKQLSQESTIWYGFTSFLLYSVLYEITSLFLIINHLEPTIPPVLPIDKQDYYFWQFFFGLIIGPLGWLILGGGAYLFGAKFLKTDGSLRNFLNSLSFSLFVPLIWIIWLPETIIAISFPYAWQDTAELGVLWELFMQIYIPSGIAWAYVLSAMAVKEVTCESWSKSALIALFSFITTIGFYMIFIR